MMVVTMVMLLWQRDDDSGDTGANGDGVSSEEVTPAFTTVMTLVVTMRRERESREKVKVEMSPKRDVSGDNG